MSTTRKRVSKKQKHEISPKRFKRLNSFISRISRILDLSILLTEVYRELLVLFGSRDVAVILSDRADAYGLDGVIHARRSEGFSDVRLDIQRKGIGNLIAEANGPTVLEDLLVTGGVPELSRKRFTGTIPGCVLGMPIICDGRRCGIIVIGRQAGEGFSAEDRTVLELAVEHTSNAIQNALRFRFEKLCSLEWIGAVNALKEGILVHDRANRIVRVNRRFAEMVGRDIDTLVGQPCADVLPESTSSGCVYCATTQRRRTNGNSRVSTCTIKDENDAACSIVHVIQAAKENGVQPDGGLDTLGSLISGVAHEVKSPLTGIIGYSELALEQIRDKKLVDDKVLEYLNRIHSEGNRAYRVIHDLLYFARRDPPETGRVRVNEILGNLLEGESRRLKRHSIRLEKDLKEIPDVWGDPRQIQQVLANILSNGVQALMAVETGRELYVMTEPVEKGIRVSFRDTGLGIPAGVRPRVFDPFFGTPDFSEGVGLGLSVAYGIVNAHGGDINLNSTEQGTEVIVRLPERRET